jgi:cytidylate kinase
MPRSHAVAHTSERAQPAVVTIDGPSGAGKSTVARALARELGFVHLDTGAMYRAVTWALLERGLLAAGARPAGSPVDSRVDSQLDLEGLGVELDAEGKVRVDGRSLGDELRAPRVEEHVSAVSAMPAVRALMTDLPRRFAARGSLVCEGRDMGTVVFPDARHKFFLVATVAERARRRLRDFEARGRTASLAEVEAEIAARDAQDESRDLAPLRAAADAEQVDTTGMTIDEVVARLARSVRAGRSAVRADHAGGAGA